MAGAHQYGRRAVTTGSGTSTTRTSPPLIAT
jgi:hypothetical protein